MSHNKQDAGGPLVNSAVPPVIVVASCSCSNTIANTTAELDIIPATHAEVFVLTPSHMAKDSIVSYRNSGYISTDSSQDSTIRIYIGGTKIIDSTGTLPNNLTNQYVELCIDILFLGDNKLRFSGRTLLKQTTGISTVAMRSFVCPGEIDIDCGIPLKIRQTYQWSAASPNNSLTIHDHTLELRRL